MVTKRRGDVGIGARGWVDEFLPLIPRGGGGEEFTGWYWDCFTARSPSEPHRAGHWPVCTCVGPRLWRAEAVQLVAYVVGSVGVDGVPVRVGPSGSVWAVQGVLSAAKTISSASVVVVGSGVFVAVESQCILPTVKFLVMFWTPVHLRSLAETRSHAGTQLALWDISCAGTVRALRVLRVVAKAAGNVGVRLFLVKKVEQTGFSLCVAIDTQSSRGVLLFLVEKVEQTWFSLCVAIDTQSSPPSSVWMFVGDVHWKAARRSVRKTHERGHRCWVHSLLGTPSGQT